MTSPETGALSSALRQQLHAAGLDPAEVAQIAERALTEDLRLGPDLTTAATVAADATATARLVAREAGVLAGLPVALAVVEVLANLPQAAAGPVVVTTRATDGQQIEAGQLLATLDGPLRTQLTAERSVLNLLTHLSGIATLTARWVAEVAGTGALIRDTRKTLPGMRSLQKYAVRAGGGHNHRLALGDAALIKDNHIAAAGGLAAAVAAVRALAPDLPLEVECDTVRQVSEAVAVGAGVILLDNMSLAELTAAVTIAHRVPGILLEASGGLTLATARAVADTGVDYLAVGALTHSAPILDIGLDLPAPL